MSRSLEPESFLPLTPSSFHILVALGEGERHGYAIKQAVEERSRGQVNLGPGNLYGTLKRLLEDELIEESPQQEEGGRQRRYRLTPLGRQVAALETRWLAALVRWARSSRLIREAE